MYEKNNLNNFYDAFLSIKKYVLSIFTLSFNLKSNGI